MTTTDPIADALAAHYLKPTFARGGSWECSCGHYLGPAWDDPAHRHITDHRTHVAEQIRDTLGNRLTPDGYVTSACARGGEPILVEADDPENFGMTLCDPCSDAVATQAQKSAQEPTSGP